MVILTCFEAEQATETSCFELIHSVGTKLISDLLKRKNKRIRANLSPTEVTEWKQLMNMLSEIKIAFSEEIRSFSCLLRNHRQTISYSSPKRLTDQLILIVEMFALLYRWVL